MHGAHLHRTSRRGEMVRDPRRDAETFGPRQRRDTRRTVPRRDRDETLLYVSRRSRHRNVESETTSWYLQPRFLVKRRNLSRLSYVSCASFSSHERVDALSSLPMGCKWRIAAAFCVELLSTRYSLSSNSTRVGPRCYWLTSRSGERLPGTHDVYAKSCLIFLPCSRFVLKP